ncbi:MAG: phosphate ABC transporter substrate-binding protein PstS [Crenarchaeota archaeon]|nr:phosphate ABC transporter substrate-binding protein PstS [Thermoproteota archaeon]
MKNTLKISIAIAVIAIIVIGVFAATYLGQPASSTNPSPNISPTISPTSSPTSSLSTPVTLNAAGASFPYPLLTEIIEAYNLIKSNVQINYQPTGSGAGITSLKDRLVDFAGSDAPLSESDMQTISNVVQIPETIGAVAVTYNWGSETSPGIQLTGQIIADIFQGKITKWNDDSIAQINPGITLPDKTITVVHRSDGSGTTFIFTSYLCKVSASWESEVGHGKSVSWPTGVGSSGNAGVAGVVKGTPYTIGYVELAYAEENSMPVAKVQNPSGNYILPTMVSTELAASSAASAGLPAGHESWANVDILNAEGSEAYPIVSFSYLMVYKELNVISGMTQEKATALVDFLWYIVHDGQEIAPELLYASLPDNVITINEATLRSITFNGQTLIS